MKTIGIGFSRGKTILSRLICWVTRSSVSHTYIRVESGLKDPAWIVYQASGISVNAENFDHFEARSTIVAEFGIQLTDEEYTKAMTFIISQLGKSYSFPQLIGMLWVLACRSIGIRVKNPFRDGVHSFICVELVARVINRSDAEELTPQDLLEDLGPE